MARKILLADDSVTAQNMGRKILSEAGYEVLTVSNGSAALKKISEQRPDIIILDVYMPGYSGLEVCQRLKETRDTAGIPVLLTVGKLEPFRPEESRRARADAFIIKPFEASELLATMKKLEEMLKGKPESAKPGRFARLAGLDSPEPPDKDAGITEEGWKDRLPIPRKSKAPEPEPHPMPEPQPAPAEFRDRMRPEVVEPSRISAFSSETAIPEQRPGPQKERALPQITPEEIAALQAAAAALIRAEEDPPASLSTAREAEEATVETQPAPAVSVVPEAYQETVWEPEEVAPAAAEPGARAEEPPAPAAILEERLDERMAQTVAEVVAPQVPEPPTVAEIAGSAAAPRETLAAAAEGTPAPQSQADTFDLPAEIWRAVGEETASSSGSRWIAEPVPLDENEAAVSLEQEMTLMYAEIAAREAGANGGPAVAVVEPVTEAAAGTAESTPAEPVEATFAVAASAAAEVQTAAVAAEATALGAASEIPTAPPARAAYASAMSGGGSGMSEPQAPVSSEPAMIEPAMMPEVARAAPGNAYAAAASAATNGETFPAAESSRPTATASAARNLSPQAPEPEPDRLRDSDMAAAWAHWHEIRETIVGSSATNQIAEAATAAVRESEAKDADLEAAAAAAPADPEAIANIVDRVLADLRPKLVAEIARKLKNDQKKG